MKQNISWGVTGLLLAITSGITAAILPNNEDKQQFGRLVVSNDGAVANQLTCSLDQATGDVCNWSVTRPEGNPAYRGRDSRTSTSGKQTSSITNVLGNKVKTITNNPGPLNHTSYN